MSYLLDTNVVSERSRPQPDERVRAWLRAHTVGETFLSVITLAELEQGVLRLGETRRASELRDFLVGIETQFAGRVLPVDRAVARTWAAMTARALGSGQPMGYADSLIAATALTHGLSVVTRNVNDFRSAQVEVINPWESAGAK